MPANAVVGLTILAAAYVMLAPLKRALATLFAVTLLVPDILIVPRSPSSYVTVSRVILFAFAAGLVFRRSRGELPSTALRLTPVHVALAAFALVAFLNGIMFASDVAPIEVAMTEWIRIVDQLVFFVAVLAAIRAIGDEWWVARMVAGMLIASAAVGIGEHFTNASWGRWFYHEIPEQLDKIDGARQLEFRGGFRVRGAAEFALAYGWIVAILLPILVAVASRARRALIPIAGIAASVTAIYWSLTRSPLLGAIVALVIVWMFSGGDKRLGFLVVATAALGAVVFLASPDLLRPFGTANAQGSVDVRITRLPAVLEVAADRPMQGIGLGGLTFFDLPTTDASYLRTYAELGVPGFTVFVVLLLICVWWIVPALRAPPGRRTLAAATLTGVILGLGAAAALDLFSLPGTSWPFWMVVALGVFLRERSTGEIRRPSLVSLRWRRLALVPFAAACGVLVWTAAPTHASGKFAFQVLAIRRESLGTKFPLVIEGVLQATGCGIVDAVGEAEPGIRLTCHEKPGLSEFDVEGRTAASVGAVERKVLALAREHIAGFRLALREPPSTDRPTWATTAPASGAIGVMLFLMAAPRPRRKRAWALMRMRPALISPG